MREHRSFFSAFCPLSAFRDRTFVLSIFSAFIRHEHRFAYFRGVQYIAMEVKPPTGHFASIETEITFSDICTGSGEIKAPKQFALFTVVLSVSIIKIIYVLILKSTKNHSHSTRFDFDVYQVIIDFTILIGCRPEL